MKNGICPKCDGSNVVGNIRKCIGPFGGWYGVTRGRREAYRPEYNVADIRAWICEDCGFTEFYTVNAERIAKVVDRADASARRHGLSDSPFRVSAGSKE